eukprot:Pgem_evm1s10648
MDLGCGSARDLCFLAERAKVRNPEKYIRFFGLDRHCSAEKRGEALFKNHNVEFIKIENIDLRKIDLFWNFVRCNSESGDNSVLIYAVRYLNRE